MNSYLFVAVIAGLSALMYGVYHSGESNGMMKCANKIAEANESAAKRASEIQNELYDTEKAWLDEESKKEIIYRDRIKTVTEVVEKYVETNNLEHCRIGADGMQSINKAMSAGEGKD